MVPGQVMRYHVPDPGSPVIVALVSGLWLMRFAAVTGSTACDVHFEPELVVTVVVGAPPPPPVPWVNPALTVTSLPFVVAPEVSP